MTVLLVTHSMEEAQRLCDRVAIIAGGKTVAVDTPAGLIERVRGPAKVHIRAAEPFDPAMLHGVPQATGVVVNGEGVVVTGSGGDMLPALMARLLHHGVPVTELRVDQPTLDDAYLALTDHRHPLERSA